MSEKPKRFRVVDRMTAQAVRSPYREALDWINRNPGTSSAAGLAKLILSLWNGDVAFSFRECINSLDGGRTQLALRMVAYFADHGEDPELVQIGHEVCEVYPRLWELGDAADQAKVALRQWWSDEEDRPGQREKPDATQRVIREKPRTFLTYKTYSTAPGYRSLGVVAVDKDGQEYELRLNPDGLENLIFACADVAKQIGDHPPLDWDQFPRTVTWPHITTWKPGA